MTFSRDEYHPDDEHDVFGAWFYTRYQRPDDPPPPPKRPATWRRTFTKPGPRWQLRRWLDTDMQEHMP